MYLSRLDHGVWVYLWSFPSSFGSVCDKEIYQASPHIYLSTVQHPASTRVENFIFIFIESTAVYTVRILNYRYVFRVLPRNFFKQRATVEFQVSISGLLTIGSGTYKFSRKSKHFFANLNQLDVKSTLINDFSMLFFNIFQIQRKP
jgi:hypothetical protein